jgi:hypothetical protein
VVDFDKGFSGLRLGSAIIMDILPSAVSVRKPTGFEPHHSIISPFSFAALYDTSLHVPTNDSFVSGIALEGASRFLHSRIVAIDA